MIDWTPVVLYCIQCRLETWEHHGHIWNVFEMHLYMYTRVRVCSQMWSVNVITCLRSLNVLVFVFFVLLFSILCLKKREIYTCHFKILTVIMILDSTEFIVDLDIQRNWCEQQPAIYWKLKALTWTKNKHDWRPSKKAGSLNTKSNSRILFGILVTWPTPCQGLCNSPTYLSRSSSPCIRRMSSLVLGKLKYAILFLFRPMSHRTTMLSWVCKNKQVEFLSVYIPLQLMWYSMYVCDIHVTFHLHSSLY